MCKLVCKIVCKIVCKLVRITRKKRIKLYQVLVFEKFWTGYDQISPLSSRNYTSPPCFNNVSPRVSSFKFICGFQR